MMTMSQRNPALVIDLQKIYQNACTITTQCAAYGIQVAAVTKGFCALPVVADVMLQGGCVMLADSRIRNLQKLHEAHFKVEHLLLRSPMLSEAEDVVRYADISLNSEIATIQALDHVARTLHTRHKIILMIDIGDLREGIWPDQLDETVQAIMACDAIDFAGIGCNLGCYGGIIPSPENMQFLFQLHASIEHTYNLKLPLISGGSTSGLQLVASGRMPSLINHLRVGEGILLGRSTTDRFIIPNTYQNAFQIRGEIIESNRKPSIPIGERGKDAFGNIPTFQDRGIRQRVIVALGRQDISRAEDLLLPDDRLCILGVTSDHLIVDVTEGEQNYRVGDTLEFSPDYPSLLAAATSQYVHKEFI
jgi:ornithine racemase